MPLPSHIKALGFAAYSGTGKTTLLKQLVPELRAHGLRLAIIKHSHHDFEIDHPGKDSYELHHAGSLQTLITSKYRSALISEHPEQQEPDLLTTLYRLDLDNIDLVLVEGFRDDSQLPRIELHRPSLGKPLIYPQAENIIAIASDESLQTHLPVLDLNQVPQIIDFIIDWIKPCN
jgi:molybdopterin-guanine dinucleotide biosynthesis protein MobB